MKEFKKLIFDGLLFLINLFGFLVVYFSLFVTKVLTIDSYIILTGVNTWFYTKSIIDKQDLENKIYELKELISAMKTKTEEK